MKLKNILAVLMALSMTLSLAACTGKDKPEAWKALALSGGKDEFGNTQPGGALILNPTTGENRYVQGGQGGATGNPPKVSTQSSFDALPKGAEYIGADGRKCMK